MVRMMKALKPFIKAVVATGGLTTGTLVRDLLISQLDDMEDDGTEPLFGGGFDRWMLSGFLDSEVQEQSLKESQLNISNADVSSVKKAVEVMSLVLDSIAIVPSIDLEVAVDFSLGYCMTYWGLASDNDTLESHLEFLHRYATARNDTWAITILDEALDEATRTGTNDLAFILIEAEDRTPLLKGLHSAASQDYDEFSEILSHMNGLRADQLMLLADHAAFSISPGDYE
jgi:hypothetical protein